MNLSLHIARRYLFAKKSHNAINIISMVSACGVAITTMALICTLSVFNGFQLLISDLFTTFDPELKITALKGKTFIPEGNAFEALRAMKEVDVVCEVLEEKALIEYRDRQVTATVKGVSENYTRLTDIDRLLATGEFKLTDGENDYTILGAGLASQLGCHSSAIYPVYVYAPQRKGRINMANPMESFNSNNLYVSGIFSINQPVYDEQYLLTSLETARLLFDYENEVSALELKLADDANPDQVQRSIRQLEGMEAFNVQNRYEQQEEAYRMTEIEKWITFLILTFILLIAAFNVIGSLSMLMIDKREDIGILRNLGATDRFIRRIFLYEGWMISLLGATIGLVVGIALCLIQEHYGIISLGGGSGSFVTDTYPVKLMWNDVFIVALVVGAIGFLTAWYPVKRMLNKPR